LEESETDILKVAEKFIRNVTKIQIMMCVTWIRGPEGKMRAPPGSNGVHNFLGKVSSITKFKIGWIGKKDSTRLLGRRKEEKKGNVFLFNDCEKKRSIGLL
jgi:hypothetical protein